MVERSGEAVPSLIDGVSSSSSFLEMHITEDLTWTPTMLAVVKNVQQSPHFPWLVWKLNC